MENPNYSSDDYILQPNSNKNEEDNPNSQKREHDSSSQVTPATIRNFGNTFCFFFCKNEPLIVIGPQWYFYVVISLLMTAIYCILFIYLRNHYRYSNILQIIGSVAYGLHFFSYTLVSFQNPGVPKEVANQPLSETYKTCNLCYCSTRIDSGKMAFHCNECNVCIEGYDHHCQWTTKCVGSGNICCFYLFLVTTFLFLGAIFLTLGFMK